MGWEPLWPRAEFRASAHLPDFICIHTGMSKSWCMGVSQNHRVGSGVRRPFHLACPCSALALLPRGGSRIQICRKYTCPPAGSPWASREKAASLGGDRPQNPWASLSGGLGVSSRTAFNRPRDLAKVTFPEHILAAGSVAWVVGFCEGVRVLLGLLFQTT